MNDAMEQPTGPAGADSPRKAGMRNAILTQFFGVLGMQSFENGVLLLYLTVLGVPPTRILVYLALPNGVSMLFRLPVGYAADLVGKKRFGLTGVTLTTLGYGMLPVAAFFAEGVRTAFILSGILTLAAGKMLFAAGWHAMIGGLVPETQRARFYSRMRLAFQTGGILFAGVVALLLGRDSPLWMFQLILGFLVLCFVLRVVFYVRVPEVERTGERHGGFWPALGRVLSNAQYVSFCAYVFLLTLFTKGAMNLFALVEKHVLELSDGMVVLLANTSMAGGILGFLLVGRFVDRVGTRYVFLVCHCAFAVSMFVFLARGGFPFPVVVPVAAAHFVFGVSGAASGIAIMTEMLALIPPTNKALSTSVCVSLVLGGASLSGLLAAGVLDLGFLREHWVLWGQTMSRYDAVLLAYATMVLLLVITLGLVPSVLRPAGWTPPGSTE